MTRTNEKKPESEVPTVVENKAIETPVPVEEPIEEETNPQPQIKYVERAINMELLNEKLNYIISILEGGN